MDTNIPHKDRFTIDKKLGDSKFILPNHPSCLIAEIAKEDGLSTSLQFIQKSCILWENLTSEQNKIVILTGVPGSGKSTILTTVLTCIDKSSNLLVCICIIFLCFIFCTCIIHI